MIFSVVIPTYKNVDILLKNLQQNLPLLKDCEVIIVNDDPEKSIREDLKEFPNLILLENKKNLGFAAAANQGIKRTKNRYVMLLNSDVTLLDDSYKITYNYFQRNKNLFAVAFAQKEKNDQILGKNIIFWKNGLFYHKTAPDIKAGINAWAEGGASVVDKQKFLELGGFNTIYSPFYWEDIDLSYRAWKANYSIIFEPKILIVHHHESTIGKYFTKNQIKTIAYRNQLVFIWKNITNLDLIVQHLLHLPIWIMAFLIKGESVFAKAFLNALLLLPKILIKKAKIKKSFVVPDKKILSLFKNE